MGVRASRLGWSSESEQAVLDSSSQEFFPHRTFWHSTTIAWVDEYGEHSEYEEPENKRDMVSMESANLISSFVEGDIHAPVIDIDFPIAAIPSRSPGHYHLYLDIQISWRRYRKLLKQMMRCGIIEKGYYRASKKRKMTMVRWDWTERWFGLGDERRRRLECLKLRAEMNN